MRRVGLALDGMYSRQEMEQFVREAEDRGLDSLWIDEGILRDAVSVLAAVAVQSHTIRLATGILNVFSRTPLLLAMTAASLDQLSNGRFILGLGAAHKPLVEQLHGLSFGQPLERVRDYVAIIRQVVAGQKVTYQGQDSACPGPPHGLPSTPQAHTPLPGRSTFPDGTAGRGDRRRHCHEPCDRRPCAPGT